MFKNSGPTTQQMSEASFVYWLFAYGYKEVFPIEQQHEGKPNRKAVTTCKGSDAGYIAVSGCVLSAELALIREKDSLSKEEGVYIRAAAFGDSSNVMDHAPRHILLYERFNASIVLQL